ncbi:hypothetical protein EDF46_3168 [Frondihabitans sp. PhB188]|uniref:DUF5719 family protein n=1 Tax=Frondihabitans sp. PhB188 TaxID=2485200 RepID=UPI000F463FAC|nr:DUF5719 family protein [Frondihabitans sp. PhB188]ROQ36625.1 hypothetical protein EDF46_3168 [Frondihabitans sp. PhB188]
MSRRTAKSTGLRLGLGVVALAVGGAVVAAAVLVPLPTLSETPAGRIVTPVALDQQRVCGGSLLRLSGDSGASATSVSAVGTAATVTAAGGGDAPTTKTLAGADGTGSDPLLVTAASGGSTTVPLVAAAQSASSATSDLTGFAASSCAEPTSSTWLVGGSTDTGRTTLISLVNPTDVNSTVDLSVFGESGTVDGPGLTGIVVAPNSQKVVPLSGFATGLTSPVVHVTSTGGQIVADLQVSVVRTLRAGGLDTVSASAAPASTVTVPGIVVRGGDALQAKAAEDGYGDLVTALRVFVPGDANADLSIQLRTADGTGATFTETAEAGQVDDIPLDGLKTGTYTATVQSSQPIVAGVRSSTIGAGGVTDLSWAAAAPALDGETLFTVPAGPEATLTLANPTSRAVTTSLAVRGKATVTLSVPAGGSVTRAVNARAVGSIRDGDGLRASISFNSSTQIASYALESPTAVSRPVTVYP